MAKSKRKSDDAVTTVADRAPKSRAQPATVTTTTFARMTLL